MSRTLEEIKQDIADRVVSGEYLPSFIVRSEDLEKFSDAIGEFMAKYIKQLEDFENIWTTYELLKKFLISKHMFFNGNETLQDLQDIATNRMKILSCRGTKKMEPEVQRICYDEGVGSLTHIDALDMGKCGWVVNRTSPLYREDSVHLNVSYIGRRELVVFEIKNNNIYVSNTKLLEIFKKYFEPKHIVTLYNFI